MTWQPPPPRKATPGLPAKLKALTDRFDQLEQSQADLQRVIDHELLPALKAVSAKAEAAFEVASKVAAQRGVKP